MNSVVSARQLTKRYGRATALSSVSFELTSGQITGLLGLNGAGKSTLLSILTGRLIPDEGQVNYGELALANTPIACQSRFGFLPEGAPLFDDLTVEAHLRTIAGIRNLPAGQIPGDVDTALTRYELSGKRDTTIDTLSKGYRRRVALAAASLGKPDILYLDEPTDGLDPFQRDRVLDQLRASRGDQTLLISTHSLEEVEALCDRVLVLHDGRLVFDGTLSELIGSSSDGHIKQAFQALITSGERAA
ncbi:MAG: multidrug ABC transporter ATP-binding protein [Ponticaulis sp.]|nr:multidrug ABC transporter ATP-binding protein [Ponticaulis sp.]